MKEQIRIQLLLMLLLLKRRRRSRSMVYLKAVAGIAMALVLLSAAVLLYKIIANSPAARISHFLPYIIIIELLCRYFFQPARGVDWSRYALLARKSNLAIHGWIVSLVNYSNLISVIFLAVFLYWYGREFHSTGSRVVFIGSWLLTIININSITWLLKVYSMRFPITRMAWLFFLGLLFMALYRETFIDAKAIQNFFINIYVRPWGAGIMMMMLAAFSKWQIVEICALRQIRPIHNPCNSDRLAQWQTQGLKSLAWIRLDAKQITRTRRMRYSFAGGLLGQVFWIYLKYGGIRDNEFLFTLFVLIASTLLAFSYGQYCFSWSSGHFNCLHTMPLDWGNFLLSKYLLLGFLILVSCIAPLFLFWNEGAILLRIFLITVYAAGAIPFVLIWFAVYNYKAIDLYSEGWLANWQGKGAWQFVMEIPCFLLPLLLVIGCSFFGRSELAFWILGFTGLLSWLFIKWEIQFLKSRLCKNKYKMLMGFQYTNF